MPGEEDEFMEIDLDAAMLPPELPDEEEQEKPEPVVEEREEEEQEEEEAPKKKLSHNQRLKIQRDKYAQAFEEAEQRAAAAQKELDDLRKTTFQAEKEGHTQLAKELTENLKSLRTRFTKALEDGNYGEVGDLQLQITETVARQREASRYAAEIKEPAPTTTTQKQVGQPTTNPLYTEWHERNPWWNVDMVLTGAAMGIDKQIQNERLYTPDTPEYWSEVDKRMREAFPEKFKMKKPPQDGGRGQGSAEVKPGKLKVKITNEDRRMASKYGLTIEQWARNKVIQERAERGDGNMEILL